MLSHALYFITCSARNQLRRQGRRLRRPRYAVAALAGFLYFFLIFGGWRGGSPADTHVLDLGRAVGPLFIALLAAWWWLWGGHRQGLVLTPAETHLLVPAPLDRRALVRFKLLQAQVPIMVSAVLGSLVTRGAPLPWPLRLLSVWVLVTTLHQHQVAASLVHAAADQQGRHGVRRHAVPLALFAAALLVLATALVGALVEVRAAGNLEFALQRLAAVPNETAPRVVLTPFRLLLAPALAGGPGAWLRAFALALAVLALHYLWIQRTDAAFEEGAARAGEQREVRVAALRAGGATRLRFSRLQRPRLLATPLLPLDLSQRPAFAIVWKNVLYSQRGIRLRALLVVGLLGVMLFLPTLVSAGAERALFRSGLLVLASAGFVIVFGPLIVRNDLRMDLANVQTLLTYPLAGRDVVGACIASATLVITVMEIPLLATGVALIALAGRIPVLVALAAIVAAAVALPVITALSVAIQNAIALLYPGWARIGAAESGGMEAVGQNMLIMIATMLLLLIALLPPLLVAAAVGAPLTLLSPAVSVPAAAGAALATAAGEVVVLTRWLGALYDRTDPVAAGLLR